jgi:hypothetical protein
MSIFGKVIDTTTMMADLFPDLGNPTMNSIEICVQIVVGIGSDWSVPGDLNLSLLLH